MFSIKLYFKNNSQPINNVMATLFWATIYSLRTSDLSSIMSTKNRLKYSLIKKMKALALI